MTKNRIEDFAFIMQRRLSRRFPEIHLSDLELADDILLLENDMQRAQSQLSGLEPSAKTANLKIGIPSTKVLTLNMGLINKVDMVCLSPVGYGV